MTGRGKSQLPRDQAVSAFSSALQRLCEDTGAVAAALVDAQGETVDYAGTVAPFDIKVAAAEWRLVLAQLGHSGVPHWSETHELFVRAMRRSYALISLDAGYALVLELRRHCASLSSRLLTEVVHDISREAGFSVPARFAAVERWKRVQVKPDAYDRMRPALVWHEGDWQGVTVLGLYRDKNFQSLDRGFRARLASGAEFFLVRERMGRWYAEGIG